MKHSIIAVSLAATATTSAATIELTHIGMTFPQEDAFSLEMAAEGTGVPVGSFGFRTLQHSQARLPGFVPRSGFLYRQFDGTPKRRSHMLIDAAGSDEDPSAGRVKVTTSVAQWPDGSYTFLVYADNRPAGGAYVSARRRAIVTVKEGKIVQSASGIREMIAFRIRALSVEPTRVEPGQPVRVSVDVEAPEGFGIEVSLRTPYTVGPEEMPAGLDYDPKTKMAHNRRREADGSFLLRTDGWPRGVVHLSVVAEMPGTGGSISDYRDFAIQVGRPVAVAIEIESDVLLCAGTHFATMVKLPDGSVRAHGYVTRDGGRTWQRKGGSIPMAHVLSDGTILGLAMRTKPVPHELGWFGVAAWHCPKGQFGGPAKPARVHVPDATSGIGHAPAAGPLFWRSMVERRDGTLLAAMYGWFKGDRSPVPGQSGSMRYRSFVVESRDRGHSWAYLSTVAYDAHIGTEGHCEPVIRRLPNGDLLALLRTGGNNRPFWQDNPLCVTRSLDGGKTWEEPVRTGIEGVSPDLCVMSDGTLACSYGRPGADLMFSTDNGRTWTDHVCIDSERYSGYTAICEVEPGILLYGYGAKDRLDPTSGKRSNQLRVARIRVVRRP